MPYVNWRQRTLERTDLAALKQLPAAEHGNEDTGGGEGQEVNEATRLTTATRTTRMMRATFAKRGRT